MNTFSFLWVSLIVILTISNIYYVFKYFLDKYLLTSKQKINETFALIQTSFLYIILFFIIINNYFIKDNFNELFKILSLGRVEPLIKFIFLTSVCLVICLALIDDFVAIYYRFNRLLLNIIIVFILIFYPFFEAINVLRAILLGETDPPFFAIPFICRIFYIYRMIALPCIYLTCYLIFLFISKRKIYNKNVYNKNLKTLYNIKNSLLFFYLMFVIGAIYLKLKDLDFFLNWFHSFLIAIMHNSFIFIVIYAGVSYYISNKDNKTELFNNLLKKIFVLNALFPIVLLLSILGYYELRELEINIIITITTAVLATVITLIINIYTNRYFNSKQ